MSIPFLYRRDDEILQVFANNDVTIRLTIDKKSNTNRFDDLTFDMRNSCSWIN